MEENLLAILETIEPSKQARTARIEELLTEVRITHIARSHGYALSGGERRSVEIARALVTNPRFILLDEPFAGIDPIAVAEIQRIVRELAGGGIGVLITDHNVRETLQIVNRAYIINQGRIFRSGSPGELAADPEVRAVYLGEDFRLG